MFHVNCIRSELYCICSVLNLKCVKSEMYDILNAQNVGYAYDELEMLDDE